MAGHSKFKNIQHRKSAQDAKRSKIFTKIIREITTATKSGIDPDSNPRLRTALSIARSKNVPKDRIDKAIKNAESNEGDSYHEIRYEGFMSGGIAIIVETLTDNKNRTVSEIRSILTKNGGNLGESGSVSHMFNHIGIIEYDEVNLGSDKFFEEAIEGGAEDVESKDYSHFAYCRIEDFPMLLNRLTERFGDPLESYIGWKPAILITINDLEKAHNILRVMNSIEDSDDVQQVFANYQWSQSISEELNKES